MSSVYSFREYDKHLCLKPSIGLWLIMLYFIRPFILKLSTIQMGIGTKSRSVAGLKELVYPDDFGFFIAFLATIPTLIVLVAFAKRKPGGPDVIRKIWHNGATLLIITAVLNVIIVFVPLLTGVSRHINVFGWMQLLIAVFITAYLLFSQRVKDTFADYPEAEGATDKIKPSPPG